MDMMPTFHLLSTFTKWVLWSGKLVGIQRMVSGTCRFFKVLNSLGENSTGIKGHSFFLITWARGPASFLMAIAIICENIPTWIECPIVSQNVIASASHQRRIPETYLCELSNYLWVFCQTTDAHQWLLVIVRPPSSLYLSPLSSLSPLLRKLLSDDANCLFVPRKLALLDWLFLRRNHRNPWARPCSVTVFPWGWCVTGPGCCIRAHVLEQPAHHPVVDF